MPADSTRKQHWETVYTTKDANAVSWYQTVPVRSLELLTAAGLSTDTVLIDIGGGDSTLVDTLVDRGLHHVTVLDLSGAALRRAQTRLGTASAGVTWLEADVTTVSLPAESVDIWHDRAVFHFLTDAEDRSRYVATATAAVRHGGTLVLATFAEDGPLKCSGLEVARYSAEGLAAVFGAAFTLTHSFGDVHRTPGGGEQRFTYAVLQRH